MDSFKNNQQNKKKHIFLRSITIVVILLGFGFSFINLYEFSKGYFANKTDPSSIQTGKVTYNSTAPELEHTKDVPSELTGTTVFSPTKETEPVLYPVRPEIGEEIGELYIPKLDATLPIYHGTSEEELEKGVGHYADSVLPGEDDNTVLAGHRDTVFRKLGEVGEGDLLIVRTSAGEFEYKVKKVRIVDKDDSTVIVPKPTATLTVSTCYPFVYIGSAPQRYILVAYLSTKTLN